MQNCSVVNESTDSFTVNCAPGFNGGLPQQFRLGVYLVKPSDGARVLVANLTSAAPRFASVFLGLLYFTCTSSVVYLQGPGWVTQ